MRALFLLYVRLSFRFCSGCKKLELQNGSRTVSWPSETSSRGVWSMAKIRSVQSPCHSKKQVEAANMGRGAMKRRGRARSSLPSRIQPRTPAKGSLVTHKKGQHWQWVLRAATPAPATSETNEQRTRGLGATVRSRSEDGHEDSMTTRTASRTPSERAQPSRRRSSRRSDDESTDRRRGAGDDPPVAFGRDGGPARYDGARRDV